MNTLFQKFICLVALLTLQIGINTLASAASPSDLQPLVDQYLREHWIDEHISTVALTAQCPGLNQSKPVSVFAGKLGFLIFPNTKSDSIFQSGSITKSFVSVVLLQLEEEYKDIFTIDDDMQKWFPEYPKWYGIKIRQLMNMTSQIPDYADNEEFQKLVQKNPYKFWKLEDIVSFEYDKPLAQEKWKYSNTNYTLLGILIRKVTHNEPDYEITNRIINKLNLKNTFYVVDKPDSRLYNRLVHGYLNLGIWIDVIGFSLSAANASGAIISTTEDINDFIKALFTPGKLLNYSQFSKLTSFVSEKTGQPIAKPTPEENNVYGLGIVASYSETDNYYYVYEGSTPGFRFLYSYFPARSISIVTAMNSDKCNKEWEFLDLVKKGIDSQCQ